jgi:uncharacterized protein
MLTVPDSIQSPCVRNCCLNEQDVCVGCYRTIDEITKWSRVDDVTKLQILTNVAERRREHRFKFQK